MIRKPGRIPCINPRCGRTAPAEKYGNGAEIVCRKCFNSVSKALKDEYRRCWRAIRKWEKRYPRYAGNPRKQAQVARILMRWETRRSRNWQAIRAAVNPVDRPQGIDGFLEEMGLN